MKAEIKAKIREALAARTPGTWSVGRGGEVVVPIGDPAIDPKMLEAEAEERRDALAKWQAAWDAASDEDREARTAAGWTRDDARHKTESDYYGGALICESVRPHNAALVAGAPAWLAELLDLDDRAESLIMTIGDRESMAMAAGAPPPGGLDLSEVITALAREVVSSRDHVAGLRMVRDDERARYLRDGGRHLAERDHALAELEGYRKLIGAIHDALGEAGAPGRPTASEVARVVAELAAAARAPATG